MNIEELIVKLSKLGVHLSVEGNDLLISAPKGTLTNELRTLITGSKTEILSLLLRHNSMEIERESMSLKPVSRTINIPLSYSQQRLWILDQLERTSAYNNCIAFNVIGSLHVAALEDSFNEIIRRHEILRTNFVSIEGQAYQIIRPKMAISLNKISFQHLSKGEQLFEIEKFASEKALQVFDIEKDPLMRVILIQLAPNEHVLIFIIHHIISDGWSMSVLTHELISLYEAFIKNKPSPLKELEIQYADFAVWQRKWLKGGILDNLLTYWKKNLKGAPPLLNIPTDRLYPSVQSFHGHRIQFNFDINLIQKIKDIGQQSETTLFMILFTIYTILLFRYSNQEDIVVGTPIANRNFKEIEPLIGFFVNTLVLRIDLSGNPKFSELLHQVRQTALDAYAHQDLPFEKLVEELQPDRNLSHSPIFQTMFVFQNTPAEKLQLPELSLTPLRIKSPTSKFDLTMFTEETEQGLRGEIEYNTDLFDEITIRRMIDHFRNLLKGIVSNPDQRISELPLLSEAEKNRLLVEWNDTKADYPHNKCIHQLFEEQVERSPDAVAVVFEDQTLTYRELNSRANQLANYLQSLGVGPEVLVGICVERSLEMVIGLLGILKAGGAYVPIDPLYPEKRRDFMVTDSQVKVLLTQKELIDKFVKFNNVQTISLDTEWDIISQNNKQNLTGKVESNNLVYMIYTSGSTGKPKGVMNTHKGVCNRLTWMQNVFLLKQSDCVMQKTPFSFDVSVWEFFWPLLNGSRLVLIKPDGQRDCIYLANLISENKISIIHFVPSMLRIFLDAPNIDKCDCLRLVICSGEALHFDIQECFFSRFKCDLYNLYGPTEAAIDVTFWRCNKNSNLGTVPIGRPISNIQIYILDQHLQLLPVGVPGELYIGGDGLARGYFNQPGLTDEKFISNPFNYKHKDRIYKTGDLARYLFDGNLEYIGRSDNLVKIRGLRIEIGEVETVISRHPAVREVLVIVTEDKLEYDKRLIAYIVYNNRENVSDNQIRHYLKERLPDYMIPNHFIELDSIPLTLNGKIDRNALSLTSKSISANTKDFIPPRDLEEYKLAYLWKNILNIHPIGVRDNFFDLGGHSLLAVCLMAQIQQFFGKTLPLATLFQNPTVEQLATLLKEKEVVQYTSPLIAIQPSGNKSPFFCVHPAGGNVFCYMDFARYLGQEQPFYGLQSIGFIKSQKPLTKIEDMATHYIKSIRTIQPKGSYNIGGWSIGGVIAFEMAQQLQRTGHEVATLVLIDSFSPLSVRITEENNDTMIINQLAKESFDFHSKGISTNMVNNNLQQPSSEVQLSKIIERAKKHNILPPNFEKKSINRLLQIFKANINAFSNYVPLPYQGKIVLFCAEKKSMMPDMNLGWSDMVKGGIDRYELKGDHYSIIQEPNVRDLSKILKDLLK